MDLRDYLDILRARWRLIVVTTLLGVMAAAVASMLATPLYQSCTTRFVSASDANANVGTLLTGSQFAQSRVKSYLDVVKSTPVMQAVIDDLNVALTPAQLASKIDVNNPLETVNLELCATDPNPEQAQRIASSTAAQFAQFAESLDAPSSTGAPLITITEFKSASLPSSPVSPRTRINIALGFLVGLAIGVGAAVLLETLDTRIKSIEVLAKYFDQPLLGVIGFDPEAAKKPLVVQLSPQSKRSESFRQVRTNLQFVDIDHRPRSIVVTSSIPREGKSTTAINLAITIAQTGQPVFLIEGDLRRPKVGEYMGIEGSAGLTDVLVGRASIDDVMQPWGTSGNLWVLAAGPLPPNPSELLGSQSMADLIHHLEKRATLIIDAPPLLPVTDAAVLSQLAGGAIIVVAANKTRREQLRNAENSIVGVGGKLLGLILNMAPAKGSDSYQYGYGESYDYDTVAKRAKFAEHPPVVPAGLGGRPAENGSTEPVRPVDPVPATNGAVLVPQLTDPKPVVAATKSDWTPPPPRAEPAKVPAPLRDEKIRPAVSSVPSKASMVVGTGQTSDAAATPTKSAMASVAVDTGPGLEVTTTPDIAVTAGSPMEQVIAGPDKVIGHSLKVPLPEPIVEDPPMAFEPDAVPVGDWTPPRPRPAFDPLTAPIEQVRLLK